MDVLMPDGTLVTDVPEGVTQSQLLARYNKFSATKPVKEAPTLSPEEQVMGSIGAPGEGIASIFTKPSKPQPIAEPTLSPEEQVMGAIGAPSDELTKLATPSLPKPPSEARPAAEFGKGVMGAVTVGLPSMWEQAGVMKDIGALSTVQDRMNLFNKIETGQITSPDQLLGEDMTTSQARAYFAADPEMREKMRERTAGEVGRRKDFVSASLKTLDQYQKDSIKYKGQTTDLTDIENAKDFTNWLAYNVGAGAVNLAPIMLAAAAAGPAGVALVGTGMGTTQALDDRLKFINEKVKDLPDEERAAAVIDYVRQTGSTTLAVGIINGALDTALGPAATLAKRGLKQVVAGEGKKAALKEGIKEIPRQIGEEFITGGAQQATQIAGQVAEKERKEFLSQETLKEILNAAAAEAAGAVGGGAATTGARVYAAQSPEQIRAKALADALTTGAAGATVDQTSLDELVRKSLSPESGIQAGTNIRAQAPMVGEIAPPVAAPIIPAEPVAAAAPVAPPADLLAGLAAAPSESMDTEAMLKELFGEQPKAAPVAVAPAAPAAPVVAPVAPVAEEGSDIEKIHAAYAEHKGTDFLGSPELADFKIDRLTEAANQIGAPIQVLKSQGKIITIAGDIAPPARAKLIGTIAPTEVAPVAPTVTPVTEAAPVEAKAKTEEDYRRDVRNGQMSINAVRDGRITQQQYEQYQALEEIARQELNKLQSNQAATLSPPQQEAIQIAEKMEALGEKNFSTGIRSAARNPSVESNLPFYREKLQELSAQQGKTAVTPESFNWSQFLNQGEEQKYYSTFQQTAPENAKAAFDGITNAILDVSTAANNLGYKINDIKNNASLDLRQLKSQYTNLLSDGLKILSGNYAIQKGYKRANQEKFDLLIKNSKDTAASAQQAIRSAVPKPEEIAEAQQRADEGEAAIRKIKNKPKLSLWNALKGSLGAGEMSELFPGKVPLYAKVLQSKTGRGDMTDLVSDGKLDDFLPPNMRHDIPTFDAQESSEYIKERVGSQNYLSHDTEMEIEEIFGSIEEAERIVNEYLTIEEQNYELEEAANEQRESEGVAFSPESEGEISTPEPDEGEALTPTTPEGLRAEEERRKKIEAEEVKAKKEASDKAKADAEVGEFILSGSKRAVDVADAVVAASGQKDIFAQEEEPAKEEAPAKQVLSLEYKDALKESREATADFKEIQQAYRAKEIGDREFLAGKKSYEVAMAKFDEAFEKEQEARPTGEIEVLDAEEKPEAVKLSHEPYTIEGDFTEIGEEKQHLLLSDQSAKLTEDQNKTLESQYGAKRDTAEFLDSLRKDVIAFITQGAQAVNGKIRAIIRRVANGVLAVAIVFNPQFVSKPYTIAIPQYDITTSEVIKELPKEAKTMSDAAKRAYGVIYPALEKQLKEKDKLFIVADKQSGNTYMFNPDGSLLLQSKTLFGLAIGDYMHGDNEIEANRITPAGVFDLGLRDAKRSAGEAYTAGEYDFGKVFVLDKSHMGSNGPYSNTIMHSVWTHEADAKKRLAALDKPGAEDSRYSFGCINVNKETFKYLITNHLSQIDGAKIFIVPENGTNVMDFINGKAMTSDDIIRQRVEPVTKTTVTERRVPAPKPEAERKLVGREEVVKAEVKTEATPEKKPKKREDQTFYSIEPSAKKPDLKSAAGMFDKAALDAVSETQRKSRYKTIEMAIDDFLALADRIPSEATSTVKADEVRKLIRSGTKFSSIPYLYVSADGETLKVVGHEGRNRAAALRAAGFETMPVELRADDTYRWSEQADPDKFDYSETWPTRIEAQEDALNPRFSIPMPFTREQSPLDYVAPAEDQTFSGIEPESNNFKRWFGNSKVMDADGNPLVVYHGTKEKFNIFDTSKALDGAMWFASNPAHADFFARGKEGNVIGAYLSLKNPMVINQDDLDAAWDKAHPDGEQDERGLLPRSFVKDFVAKAKKSGNDGLIIEDFGDLNFTSTVYLAFEPTQIKSATGNLGTYDPNNPDIRYSLDTYTSEEKKKRSSSLKRDLKTLNRMRKDGRITDEQFVERADAAILADEQARFAKDTPARQRGYLIIQEKMSAAVRRGEMTREGFDLANWFMSQNEALVDDLAAGIKGSGRSGQGGYYNVANRIMVLIKNGGSSQTATHEILHHLERMMPPKVQQSIRKAWASQLVKAKKAAKTPAEKLYFAALMEVHYGSNSPENIEIPKGAEKLYEGIKTAYEMQDQELTSGDIARELLVDSRIPGSFYEYFNPSEFWAVNGSDIVQARYEAVKGGVLARLKSWLREFSHKVLRPLFGLKTDASIMRALDSLAKSDGKFVTKEMLGEGDYNQVIRNIMGNPAPTALWDSPEPSFMDGIIYQLADKQIDTKRVVDEIRKTTGQIDERLDAYTKESLYSSRSAARIEDFLKDKFTPLFEQMKALGVTAGELEAYLHNRHAEERNEQINKINLAPDIQDIGSGISTDDAQKYLAGLPAAQKAKLQSLAAKVDGIIEGTQKLLVDSGLETKETVDTWNKTYKHYIPLQRDDLDFVHTGSGYVGGVGTKGTSSRRAVGSIKPVKDILANIAIQRERAIRRSEQATVGRALYGLAITSPNPGFWLPVNPNAIKNKAKLVQEMVSLGLTIQDAENLIQEPKVPVIDKATGLVKYQVNPSLRGSDNVFPIRINGEDRFIIFNPKDERSMRMAKSLKNLDADELGWFLGNLGAVTRWIASINTQYNPVFGAWNMARDVQSAALNLSTTEIAGSEKEVLKGTFPAMFAIWNDLRGKPAKNAEQQQYMDLFNQMRLAGGTTGFAKQFSGQTETFGNFMSRMKTGKPKEKANIVEQELKRLDRGSVMKKAQAVFDWLSDYNDAMENAVRLSAFKVALKEGHSEQKAASIAKELTVNFNRKGASSPTLQALYAFINASIQGSIRLGKTLKGPSGRKIIAGGITLGVIQAIALALNGYDDGDPPDFLKDKNFIIPIPFAGKNYVAIPMPMGFNIFPGIGRILTEATLIQMGLLKSNKGLGDKVASMGSLVLDAFNPLGAGSLTQMIAPTAFDPLFAISANKDAFGRPITKEDRATQPTPGYQRSRQTASIISQSLAEFMNWASSPSGTKHTKGWASPTADQIDYLAGQYFGGVTREIIKAGEWATSKVTGEEIPAYRVPIVGKLYGETASPAAVSAKFYDNVAQMAKYENEVKQRQINKEPVEKYLKANPEARLWRDANSIENQVSKLNAEKKEHLRLGRKAQAQNVEKTKTRIMKQFNDRVTAAQ